MTQLSISKEMQQRKLSFHKGAAYTVKLSLTNINSAFLKDKLYIKSNRRIQNNVIGDLYIFLIRSQGQASALKVAYIFKVFSSKLLNARSNFTQLLCIVYEHVAYYAINRNNLLFDITCPDLFSIYLMCKHLILPVKSVQEKQSKYTLEFFCLLKYIIEILGSKMQIFREIFCDFICWKKHFPYYSSCTIRDLETKLDQILLKLSTVNLLVLGKEMRKFSGFWSDRNESFYKN